MAKGEAHQAGNLQAACDGDGPLAVPSQLVVEVGFKAHPEMALYLLGLRLVRKPRRGL